MTTKLSHFFGIIDIPGTFIFRNREISACKHISACLTRWPCGLNRTRTVNIFHPDTSRFRYIHCVETKKPRSINLDYTDSNMNYLHFEVLSILITWIYREQRYVSWIMIIYDRSIKLTLISQFTLLRHIWVFSRSALQIISLLFYVYYRMQYVVNYLYNPWRQKWISA